MWKLLAVLTCLGATAAGAEAQETGGWTFDRLVDPYGTAYHSASAPSRNLISSGEGEDYPVVLTVSCRNAGPERGWRLNLLLRDQLSASDRVAVTVSIDNQPPFARDWTVTEDGRGLFFAGPAILASLRGHRRASFAWNWGWSWLWLSDEAIFDLRGLGSVTYTLSKTCGLTEP